MVTYYHNGQLHTNYLGNYYDNYGGVDVDSDGVGDSSYAIGTEWDNYPLTGTGFEVIPEFPFLLPSIVSLLVVFGIVRLLDRNRIQSVRIR
jgi:hypothetical protein